MPYKLTDLRYQNKAISPEKMLANLTKEFDFDVSVGIWCFTPGGGRFHERFVREASIPERIDLAARMADTAISWPGMDGYRYLHGKPFMHMWDLFETTLAEAMDEVPGVRVAIEPKGYEPAPNNIGVINPHEAEALLYSLWAYGYKQYFGIDINPENMPVQKAVEINIKALEKMKERISRLPHEKIIECHLHPEKHRGELEEILIENL